MVTEFIIHLLGGYTSKEVSAIIKSKSQYEVKGEKYDSLLSEYRTLQKSYGALLKKSSETTNSATLEEPSNSDLSLDKKSNDNKIGNIHFPKIDNMKSFNVSIMKSIKTGYKAKVNINGNTGYIRLSKNMADKLSTPIDIKDASKHAVVTILKH